MKTFSMTHLFFDFAEPEVFTEDKAPEWLTKGDYLHFWNNCVLKLEVSGFVDTDFRRITRIKQENNHGNIYHSTNWSNHLVYINTNANVLLD